MARDPDRPGPATGEPEGVPVSLAAAAMLLQERWVLLILAVLLRAGGAGLGFAELRRRAGGVNPTTLTDRLELLERERIVARRVLSTTPPRTEYRLTEAGEALRATLEALEDWAAAHRSKAAATRRRR